MICGFFRRRTLVKLKEQRRQNRYRRYQAKYAPGHPMCRCVVVPRQTKPKGASDDQTD